MTAVESWRAWRFITLIRDEPIFIKQGYRVEVPSLVAEILAMTKTDSDSLLRVYFYLTFCSSPGHRRVNIFVFFDQAAWTKSFFSCMNAFGGLF